MAEPVLEALDRLDGRRIDPAPRREVKGEQVSQEDRAGILRSIDRCTVKKVVQRGPEFKIESVESLGQDAGLIYLGGGATDFLQPIRLAPQVVFLTPGLDLRVHYFFNNRSDERREEFLIR